MPKKDKHMMHIENDDLIFEICDDLVDEHLLVDEHSMYEIFLVICLETFLVDEDEVVEMQTDLEDELM
jgi:threonine dehydratase